jgi:hypothetical protein
MKIIALTSNATGEIIYINVDTIGHIYDVEKKNTHGEILHYTKVGTTTHNNGGFEVLEDAKEILQMISDDKFNVLK